MGSIEYSNFTVENLHNLHKKTKELTSKNLYLCLHGLGCDSNDYIDYSVQLENVSTVFIRMYFLLYYINVKLKYLGRRKVFRRYQGKV